MVSQTKQCCFAAQTSAVVLWLQYAMEFVHGFRLGHMIDCTSQPPDFDTAHYLYPNSESLMSLQTSPCAEVSSSIIMCRHPVPPPASQPPNPPGQTSLSPPSSPCQMLFAKPPTSPPPPAPPSHPSIIHMWWLQIWACQGRCTEVPDGLPGCVLPGKSACDGR